MGKCLHFPMALLLLFYVAKATTEMERSGIEVRAARCGRSRCVHVAKATTEMERSGIEVRVAPCGRSRCVHVAKATTDTLNTWRGIGEPSEKARRADGAKRNRGTRCSMRLEPVRACGESHVT